MVKKKMFEKKMLEKPSEILKNKFRKFYKINFGNFAK